MWFEASNWYSTKFSTKYFSYNPGTHPPSPEKKKEQILLDWFTLNVRERLDNGYYMLGLWIESKSV